MSETASTDPGLDEREGDYRTVEPWAVGGLLLGLASIVSLWGGIAMLVAAIGVLANLIAADRNCGRQQLLARRQRPPVAAIAGVFPRA